MEFSDLAYIDSTGYHYSDYASFLTWVQDKYRGIYGADTYLEPDSQDGQFVAVLAKSFYDMAALGASIYSSYAPTTAQGTGLSRLVKINGINRLIPTKSTVPITIVGQNGTVITDGVVMDTLNQKWDVPTTTIPGAGTITVTATAQEDGAITAAINTVTQIFTPTLGWQSVNNATAATAGDPVEEDSELRTRQAISTAIPSLTVFDGTIGAVANVTGVTDVRGYENDSGVTDANGISAHSIYVVVKGGDSTAVAQAIQVHKTPGTGTDGTTTVVVTDAHGMPLAIKFKRPDTATIGVEITVAVTSAWTIDYAALIQAAVANYIKSVGIGNDVLITKLYIPAYLIGTAAAGSFDINLLRIKKNAGAFGTSNISILFNEIPFCDAAVDVTVIET